MFDRMLKNKTIFAKRIGSQFCENLQQLGRVKKVFGFYSYYNDSLQSIIQLPDLSLMILESPHPIDSIASVLHRLSWHVLSQHLRVQQFVSDKEAEALQSCIHTPSSARTGEEI